jgi:FkbM family methyltransferase
MAGFPYFLFYKFIQKDAFRKNIGNWYMHGGDKNLIKHNIASEDIVFDVGGYVGVFTKNINKRSHPQIYVFEPVKKYYSVLQKKFGALSNIKLYNIGLSNNTEQIKINITGETSSVYEDASDSTHETISLVDIREFVEKENLRGDIKLISMNIEGAEYSLIERILDTKLINNIEILQIQFHRNIPDAEAKRKTLISRILNTHDIKYSYPFVWECFTRK